VYANFFRWLGWSEQLDPMVEAYHGGDRKSAAGLAPDDLIREVFIFGSPDQIKARVQEFIDGGVTTAVLTPIAPPERLPSLVEALAPS
jgi:alkanesulfonate monooxygenase SsuD/methylene tetrahydromethanopterin reductase-like flavin-dependent oxidoreductase (luciferase family)